MYVHTNFRLNNKTFKSSNELLAFSRSISIEIYSFMDDWFNDRDFIVVSTSGSTGKPKPIKLNKEFMINSAKATGAFFQLGENTTALLCMPVNYIAGKMMLVRAMTLGWHIDIVKPVANPLSKAKKNYDFSAMVPMQLQASLKDLSKVKKLIVGGGVVSNDLKKEIENCTTEIFATYGMTETITHIAVKRLNKEGSENSFYKTLPNVTLDTDDRGCLIIKAQKVSEEVVVTNDIVELHSETSFEWLGRFDNIINSGGVKLNPEKIEEKLSNIIDERFFVTGVSDTVLGEKLILVLEGDKTSKELLNIKKRLESIETLGKYEKPKEVLAVSKFIETETKKIQRKKTLDLIL
ncbi:O-succinylbenzoic acid--CoA ligase [Tenacibaculum sp. MAR_2009_124]|uniref:AMP-binding protein n=1 Tax=Tenacibaculum sp. MAR_2009_124 TaxID=1250059 RepID=UPI000896445C|nr:AMP-binding protein [Tenacibaculum sp. MAR_2009_124]SEC92145.1 O-succinylbenzoic acid--CoA ligase [Tenacibaculum sp. MAR_2009_124]